MIVIFLKLPLPLFLNIVIQGMWKILRLMRLNMVGVRAGNRERWHLQQRDTQLDRSAQGPNAPNALTPPGQPQGVLKSDDISTKSTFSPFLQNTIFFPVKVVDKQSIARVHS